MIGKLHPWTGGSGRRCLWLRLPLLDLHRLDEEALFHPEDSKVRRVSAVRVIRRPDPPGSREDGPPEGAA